jgi:hypothetical protein
MPISSSDILAVSLAETCKGFITLSGLGVLLSEDNPIPTGVDKDFTLLSVRSTLLFNDVFEDTFPPIH